MPLLERAYHLGNSRWERADVACVLVLACVRLHRVKDASRWFARAREINASCPLLAEAAAALSAAQSSAATESTAVQSTRERPTP
jgi:hypothetical protein